LSVICATPFTTSKPMPSKFIPTSSMVSLGLKPSSQFATSLADERG
jgi:hypothetical protein